MRILIIAGSKLEEDIYFRKNNLNPKNYQIINNYDQLYGIRGCKVILVGSYWKKRDWHKMAMMLDAQGIKKEDEK